MIPRVVVLTDRSQLPSGRNLVDTLGLSADAGLEAVVVREHDLDPAERSALVVDLVRLGLWVVSSRLPDPSVHARHLAAHQSPPDHGPWGRSCHDRVEVRRAAEQGASWVTLSPFAASASKPDRDPLPCDAWTGHPVPVLALGGIDAGNAADAIDAGAHGVAVMGAVMRADDPAAVVDALLRGVA